MHNIFTKNFFNDYVVLIGSVTMREMIYQQ